MSYIEQLRHPVKSFKTKTGVCFLCGKIFQVLERHHESYEPERCVFLCHACHFKIHFQRWLLTYQDKEKLLSARYDVPILTKANEAGMTVEEFINAYAPPTRPSSFPKQRVEKLMD